MDTETLGDRVYRTLREKILQGQDELGQKLSLDQVALDLQVGNTPVREAMSRLERVGLVEVVPYIGPKIKRITVAQMQSIYEVRIALEELAIRLVAGRGEADALQGMSTALEMHERTCDGDDPRAVIGADRAFHKQCVCWNDEIALTL